MSGWPHWILAAATALATPRPCAEIAARVDGRPIRAAQVALAADLTMRRSRSTDRGYAYRSALEGLITREILSHEAETRGLKPEPTAVEAVRRDTRRLFDSDESWSSFLAAHGFDAAAYDRELRLQVLARAITVQAAEAVPVATDAEAEAHLREHATGADEPTAAQIESARWELTRMKRTAATRQLVEDARAKARIERDCGY